MYRVNSLNKEHAQQAQIAFFRIIQILHLNCPCVNTLEKEIVGLVVNVHFYIQCLHIM